MKEIWKEIKGYEGLYQISNFGRVKRSERFDERDFHLKEKILKPGCDKLGYLYVILYKNKKTKAYKIHRLVALNFIQNIHNKPEVNHIDGNKKNNNVKNLEWCTRKENMCHAFKNGLAKGPRGEKCGTHKLTWNDVYWIRAHYKKGSHEFGQPALGRKFNIQPTVIGAIVNNKIWKEV